MKIALVVALLVGVVSARVYVTHDAIIVEAASTSGERRGRSAAVADAPVALDESDNSGGSVPAGTFMLTDRACWTANGRVGICGPVRECYPNVKLSQLGNLETWMLGSRGTCNYVEPEGRQVYGVCCATHNSGAVPVPIDPNSGLPSPPTFPWWVYFPSAAPSVPTLPPWAPKPPTATGAPTTTTTTTPTTTQAPTTTTTTTTTPAPTTTTTTQKPAATAETGGATSKGVCGVGPKKMLSFDDYASRIIGGKDAVKNSWPFIVALLNRGHQFCGGSLLDSTHILTAAHCVAHMDSWDVARLEVALGMHTLRPLDPAALRRKVRRVTRHKGFDSRTLYNDIALLTLDSPVTFSSTMSPVCLPNVATSDKYAQQEAAVIGWGAIKEGGSQPSVLQQVTVRVQTNDECKKNYGGDAPGGIVDHFLCAANPGRDSCSGDSGGPLIVQNGPGAQWVQAGIVSWGIGCGLAPYPGVYTRVTSFMQWINKNAV